MSSKIQKRIIIKGRVQGVGFRYWTEITVNKYFFGLAGYVSNLMNGDVEVVVNGNEEKILSLIELLKRGPARARVDNIQIIDEEFIDLGNIFEIR